MSFPFSGFNRLAFRFGENCFFAQRPLFKVTHLCCNQRTVLSQPAASVCSCIGAMELANSAM